MESVTMKKILLPVDGSERSRQTVELVKSLYGFDTVEITVVIVREDLEAMRSTYDLNAAKEEVKPFLDEILAQLEGYSVTERVLFGRAGEEILNYAHENDIDIIIMTKSTRSGWSRMIGSVAMHVVKYAKCIVMIVPEK